MGDYHVKMASYFMKLGIIPIPLEKNKKNPKSYDWESIRYADEDDLIKTFSRDVNLGVILGTPSNNHVDVDLDTMEAVKLAPLFLPPTGLTWGRASKPVSHWLYRIAEGEVRRVVFLDPLLNRTSSSNSEDNEKGMIVEIRGNGHQTVAPPSIHPSGETIQFYNSESPSEIGIEELKRRCGMLTAAAFLARHWANWGSRHTLAMYLAGSLSRSGWGEEDVDRFITNVAQTAGDEEVEDRRRVVRDTYVKVAEDDPSSGWPTLRDFIGEDIVIKLRIWLGIKEIEQFPLNDMGNAQRLLKLHGEDVRFCIDQKIWYVWDGYRWVVDIAETMVGNRVLSIQRMILQESVQTADDEFRKTLAKWAIASGNISRINAVPSVAQDISSTWIRSDDLDRDKFKINVQNGTLNLITGGLERPHNKSEMMTKITGTPYNPKSVAPRFLLFLDQIFGGNQGLIQYIQKLAGYSLTASTQEHIFPILYGSGANGKSTLLEVIRAMMGEYCQVADATTFLQQNTDKIRSDLARMNGARLVTSSEVAQNRKLDTAMVKAITGGDKITARFLFKNDFEYTPGYKIWMATNFKPIIQGGDEAAFRRIRLIPFEIKIPEDKQDKSLRDNIINQELSGVLTWAVEGCSMWLKEGLGQPPEVEEATSNYKEDNDTISLFIHNECIISPDQKSSSKQLYGSYQNWCKSSGERYDNLTQFKDKLFMLGYQVEMGNWVGLAPISQSPMIIEEEEVIVDRANARSPFNP